MVVADGDGRLAYSLTELAERLGCSYRYLTRYADAGTLPTFMLGGTRKVSVETVRRLLAGELDVPPVGRQRG